MHISGAAHADRSGMNNGNSAKTGTHVVGVMFQFHFFYNDPPKDTRERRQISPKYFQHEFIIFVFRVNFQRHPAGVHSVYDG